MPGIRVPLPERLMRHVDKRADGCWVWTGALLPGGYGRMSRGDGSKRMVLVHRASYEHFIGPIPDGLTIDHLCRNRACVNPEHLEAVTIGENVRRAFALITHCPKGHEYTPDNTYIPPDGTRQCRACKRAVNAGRRADPANADRIREQQRASTARYRAKKKVNAS